MAMAEDEELFEDSFQVESQVGKRRNMRSQN